MKLMKLKWLLLPLFLLMAVPTQAQLKFWFPTNVRYIAGGYQNKAPYFKTLDAALNDVKSVATSSNPYTFWLDGDSLFVADWDSVYNNGVTMKDSIDIYYVATGKIKWAGFGFGGGGSGGSAEINRPDHATLHYNWPNWDQDNLNNPPWERDLGQGLDSADAEVWRLIVYLSKDSVLYIENDTLKVDYSKLGPFLDDYITATIPWQSDVVKSDTNKTLAATYTITGTLQSTTGKYILPSSAPGLARGIYGSSDSLWYTGNGSTYKSMADVNWVKGNYLPLNDTLDHGSASFSTTDSLKFVTVMGATENDKYIVTPILTDSTQYIGNMSPLMVVPKLNGFTVKRDPTYDGRVGQTFAWIRLKFK
jgi:hypothetical protein